MLSSFLSEHLLLSDATLGAIHNVINPQDKVGKSLDLLADVESLRELNDLFMPHSKYIVK